MLLFKLSKLLDDPFVKEVSFNSYFKVWAKGVSPKVKSENGKFFKF